VRNFLPLRQLDEKYLKQLYFFMTTRVFKFGGASVRNAEAVRNIARILQAQKSPDEGLVVIISAMGKTTNALEELLEAWREAPEKGQPLLQKLREQHEEVIAELFDNQKDSLIHDLAGMCFGTLERHLKQTQFSYERQYEQVVSMGEILSTTIIATYLQETYGNVKWVDARTCIRTSDRWREGKINWEWTAQSTENEMKSDIEKGKILITQGFIGGAVNGQTTTLGREGSDFSAAVFAASLNAKSVTIWKDVPGILNADPKRMPNTVLYEHLNYKDAAEMTYFGASVIHPKTIKPLANKNIPLYVRSFLNPENIGTVIGAGETQPNTPSIIYKTKQSRLEITGRNLSSINEERMLRVFSTLHQLNVKINLMQSSAISLVIITNNEPQKLEDLKTHLDADFQVEISFSYEILTIRNYTPELILGFYGAGNAVMEQKTPTDYHLVLRK
jgi:aspartate kinase